MPAKWKKKYQPDLILTRINQSMIYSSTGVTFKGMDYKEHLPVLSSMLEFPLAAARQNKSALIWNAIRRTKGGLTSESFLKALNSELNQALSQKINTYSLITSLSIQRKTLPKRISISGCTFTFHDTSLPRKFSNRRETLSNSNSTIPETPVNYCFVQVDVTERSPEAAGEKALESLDYLRGLLALHCNYTMEWSFGGGASHNPINRIRTGGFHTLHSPDGSAVDGPIWYEPNFRPAKIYAFKHGSEIYKRLAKESRSINQCSYGIHLSKAIILYARSLDQPDHTNAFVKLWSALESLTTPNVAKYDDLIRRCGFMFTEGDYHRQMLEHLRDFRNRSVHAESESEGARTNCYLLQDYFRGAIRFYLSQRKTFSSLDEANAFLDLPTDRTKLDRQIQLLRKAIKFITPLDVDGSEI